MVIGDFNNVLHYDDRIVGHIVLVAEFRDLLNMMDVSNLAKKDTVGDHFTWSNRHIYSRIDRAICNPEWFQKFNSMTLSVLEPGISDHSPLYLQLQVLPRPKFHQFWFINTIVSHQQFLANVNAYWVQGEVGTPMYTIWRRLFGLQPHLKPLIKQFAGARNQLETAILELQVAQNDLLLDRFDSARIDRVKLCLEEVIKWNEIDETLMAQKAKVHWLRVGDKNNAFFMPQ